MEYERLADLTRSEFQRLHTADLMRVLSAKAFAESKSPAGIAEYFSARWPTSLSVDLIRKAAVAAGTVTDGTWAAPLVAPSLVAAFVPLVEAQSALLRLPLRRVPFMTKVSKQTADASYSWIGENKPKPISKFAFDAITLAAAKVSGIIVITKELARLSAPGSVPAMQSALVDGLTNFVDGQFLDPAITAIAGERPASITNGLTPVATGTTLAATVAALVAAFFAALPQASAQSSLVMSPANAGLLATSGQQPDLTIAGGRAYGVNVVTTPGAGNRIVMLDPTRVLTAREDAPTIDVSEQAAIQMDSAPVDLVTAIPATGAAVIVISFWQMNYVGIKCEWALTYQAAVANAVQYAVWP